MKTLILAVLLAPAFVFPGPGVSSGDEAIRSFSCTQSGLQDAGYVVQFKNVYGAKPHAVLSIGVGEVSYKNLNGVCSRPENVDEFYLNCAFVDGFDMYQATLGSDGSPTLMSTVRKIDSRAEKSLLACYIDAE